MITTYLKSMVWETEICTARKKNFLQQILTFVAVQLHRDNKNATKLR